VSCPGPTATEFAQVAGNEKTALFKSGVMSAHAVAEDAYRAMMQGKVLSIPGFTILHEWFRQSFDIRSP
jgi:uncharacterized protein